jgi:DNA-binding transcriptional regulator YiaG
MSFSSEIKNIRRNSFMTQSEFGAAIGVSYTTVNRWENGKSLPNLKAMKAIDDFCKANNISYDVRELNTVNK